MQIVTKLFALEHAEEQGPTPEHGQFGRRA